MYTDVTFEKISRTKRIRKILDKKEAEKTKTKEIQRRRKEKTLSYLKILEMEYGTY